MKSIPVHFLSFRFTHPAEKEPAWKGTVERWYQLDAFAYGLAEAYTVWKRENAELLSAPGMILLASPQASNQTDFQFAQSGAASPAKFVHTLPNVRCSSLCQVMEWSGPVLCLQKDPFTQVHALREAAAFVESGAITGAIWVVSVFALKNGYEAQGFVVFPHGSPHKFTPSKSGRETGFEIRKTAQNSLQTDGDLQEWLNSGDHKDLGGGVKEFPEFSLPGGYQLRKFVS